MAVEILQVSVVVAANFHNPSILHHSFLLSANIVPSDWKVIDSEAISTPAASVIKYENGIVFSVELGKLQVSELVTPNRPQLDWNTSVVPEAVTRYINLLPKVPYIAVGINPHGFVPRTDATTYLLSRFAKSESLEPIPMPLRGFEVRFSYDSEETRARLTLASGHFQLGEAAKREGIIATCNYHREAKSVDEVQTALSRFQTIGSDFVQRTEALLR